MSEIDTSEDKVVHNIPTDIPKTDTSATETTTPAETEQSTTLPTTATPEPPPAAKSGTSTVESTAANTPAPPTDSEVSSTKSKPTMSVPPATATTTASKEEAGPSPLTTKTIVLTGFGGYDKLRIQQKVAPTQAGPDELLIRIRASGINFAELSIRQGLYDRLPKIPAVLGLEGSGDVIAVGHAVDGFKVGDRVLCIANLGLWTEYALVPAINCFCMPNNMGYEEAAAIPVNYITALHILFDFGNLRKGNSVLVHMAAGGVGMAATQLCKTVPDVTVYGTASAVKHETIQRNGVDHAIDYRNQDYVAEILKIDPEGVDIVMDPLSGADSVKGYSLLKPLGKIIHFGVANAMSGPTKSYWNMLKSYMGVKSYNSMELISHNKAICGYHLGHLTNHPKLVRSAVEALFVLFKDGKIKPHIDSVWAFEDIGLAMAKIQDRANIGKVIISPQKEPQQQQAKK